MCHDPQLAETGACARGAQGLGDPLERLRVGAGLDAGNLVTARANVGELSSGGHRGGDLGGEVGGGHDCARWRP